MNPLNVTAVVESTAYIVRRKYHNYIEYEDLVSLAYVWILEHESKMADFHAMEEPRLAAWRLGKDLWQVMDRAARKERAHYVGYNAKDEVFYSEAMIEAMLPRVLDGDPIPDKKDQEEIRVGKDPAEGGDYLAAYTDVQRAWTKCRLSSTERMVCLAIYKDGLSQEAAGELLELSQASVSRRQDGALRKLQEYLGGPRAAGCPYDCECHEGKLRRRPGTRGNDAGRRAYLG